ncbi:hypothetical protein PRZ48_011900 [Zasmidium cellare]|uniref:F-box domain-containing protein n=1 Tax=Zasmidium cellare TaxID=395010 RepID=A0ABR0E7P1_ZASCE|nr:hypothetical protein PRZ48_011900 [Zasmidium cellare]
MAPVCRPPAWPDGLVIIRPYFTSEQCLSHSKTGTLVIIRPYLTTREKPKATFLTLPQELRDHIYSFLPLVNHKSMLTRPVFMDESTQQAHKLYFSLIRVCRMLHKDVAKIFWSGNKIEHRYRFWRFVDRRALSPTYLVLITCLTLCFCACPDRGMWSVANISLLKSGSIWEIRLESLQLLRRPITLTKAFYGASDEVITATVRSRLAEAEEILNANGCIKIELLELINSIFDQAGQA